ncbi:MAG: alpha/beta hydrolase [Pseudomonadaceae bacterium]|nr:alpha/beta hydrolase [Pseudomonadaceae bacterium]
MPQQRTWKTALACTLALVALASAAAASELKPVERNVVYGMASGAALLLDTYQPEPGKSRHAGVVFVPGSGWFASEGYDSPALKDMASGWQPGDDLARAMIAALVDEGYTVFVPSHRASPAHRYPAAADDIARAVAFVRKHAARFDIEPAHLGGAGTSSGGNLVSLLGVRDDVPQASKLQVIATLGSPMEFVSYFETAASSAGLVSYMGFAIGFLPDSHPYKQAYRQASTVAHLDTSDAPHLLLHGSIDELVPLSQANDAAAAMQARGIEHKLIVIPGGKHSEHLLGANGKWLADYRAWFGQHLPGRKQ